MNQSTKSAFYLVNTGIIYLSAAFCLMAQPQIQWQKCLGGTSDDRAQAIQLTSDGGYVLAGYTQSNDGNVSGHHGSYDFWVAKTGASGNLLWQKALGGSGFDIAYAIAVTNEGGYILAGQTGSTDGDIIGNHGINDIWIVKLSGNGTVEWKKCIGGSQNDLATSIIQTSDGGYAIAGSSGSSDGDATVHQGGGDYWLIKISSTGDIQWQKSLGGTGIDVAYGLAQTSDGGYILNGYSASGNGDLSENKGGQDFWVVRLNSTGTIIWQKSLGGSNDDRGWSVLQASDGGFIVSGSSNSNNGDVTSNNGDRDFWLVKLSNTGVIQWNNAFGGFDLDACHAIQETPDNGYLLAGNCFSSNGSFSSNHGGSDVLVVKVGANGNSEWKKLLGGSEGDFAYGLKLTPDGGCIVAGGSASSGGDVSGNQGGEDLWLVKLNNVVSGSDLTSMDVSVSVFPNPAGNVVQISSSAVVEGAEYLLFDRLGKTILKGNLTNFITPVDISSLSPGIYGIRTSGKAPAINMIVKE